MPLLCMSAKNMQSPVFLHWLGGVYVWEGEGMVEENGGNGTEPQTDAVYFENKMLPEGMGSVSPVLSHAVLPLLVCLHGGLLWLGGFCLFVFSLYFGSYILLSQE